MFEVVVHKRNRQIGRTLYNANAELAQSRFEFRGDDRRSDDRRLVSHTTGLTKKPYLTVGVSIGLNADTATVTSVLYGSEPGGPQQAMTAINAATISKKPGLRAKASTRLSFVDFASKQQAQDVRSDKQ